MNKKGIAGIAVVALFSGELLQAIDTFDSRSIAADAPHNHVETPEGTGINVTNNLFASGGQDARVDYYLQLAPAYGTDDNGNRTVIGYGAYSFPDSGTQQMYARYETLDALLSSMGSVLGLGE